MAAFARAPAHARPSPPAPRSRRLASRRRSSTRPHHLLARRAPSFRPTQPLHVTLRIVRAAGWLRRPSIARIARLAIARSGRGSDFRVIEFNLLGNHLHLLIEADSPASLSRGMQSLSIRLARNLNTHLHRRGPLFVERYHSRILRTPREVRAVLRYVLLNERHHALDRGQPLPPHWLDPYSSAPWFPHWHHPPHRPTPRPSSMLCAVLSEPRPTASPRTWLLTHGWLRAGGPIPIDDVPGTVSART